MHESFGRDPHYLHYLHHSLASGQITGREHSPTLQQKLVLVVIITPICKLGSLTLEPLSKNARKSPFISFTHYRLLISVGHPANPSCPLIYVP